jgi:DNA-binding MarR family transcriptional regulator
MGDFLLDKSFGFTVNRAAHLLKYALLQAFKQHGYDITPEQWAVLNRLWAQDGLTQAEIADTTFKDRPVITRMVDILERKGVVSRQPDEHDRRIVRVFLTPIGREYQEKLVPIAKAMLERGRAGITDEDLETMTHTLQRIIVNLE